MASGRSATTPGPVSLANFINTPADEIFSKVLNAHLSPTVGPACSEALGWCADHGQACERNGNRVCRAPQMRSPLPAPLHWEVCWDSTPAPSPGSSPQALLFGSSPSHAPSNAASARLMGPQACFSEPLIFGTPHLGIVPTPPPTQQPGPQPSSFLSAHEEEKHRTEVT